MRKVDVLELFSTSVLFIPLLWKTSPLLSNQGERLHAAVSRSHRDSEFSRWKHYISVCANKSDVKMRHKGTTASTAGSKGIQEDERMHAGCQSRKWPSLPAGAFHTLYILVSNRGMQYFPNAKQHLSVISSTFLLPSFCPSRWASWLGSPVWCSADTWVKQSWQAWP